MRRFAKGNGGVIGASLVGGLLLVALVAPAGAHVNRRVGHLFNHLKPRFANPGTINDANNPVDWTKLKNVPAGIADGDDAVGGGGGGGAGGDITGVTAGTGLSGGGTSGDVTLNINPSFVQRRIATGCPGANQSIKTINEDGSVTCETDDVGTGGGSAGDLTTAYYAFKDGPVDLAGGGGTTLASMAVPSGRYTVNAKLFVSNFSGSNVEVVCTLGTAGDADRVELASASNDKESVALQVTTRTATSSISLVCSNSGGGTGVRAHWIKITAVSLSNVTVVPI